MRNGKTEALGILNKVTRLGFEPTLCAPLPLTLLLGIYTLATAPFHPNGFHSLSSFCLFVLAPRCGLWDLSSPTRDRTWALSSENAES